MVSYLVPYKLAAGGARATLQPYYSPTTAPVLTTNVLLCTQAERALYYSPAVALLDPDGGMRAMVPLIVST